jgi:hypothetical protein
MLSSEFAEDVFFSFFMKVISNNITVQHQDYSPIESFHSKIADGGQLTQNQANYILKLLEKYKTASALAGLDYRDKLQDLKWRHPFRILDLTKKIYVEKTENGNLEICLKFPYQLKKEFDEEINVNLPNGNKLSHWDNEDKVRRLDFYNFNLIALYEFAVKHNFDIDDTFMSVIADVEEIWQNAEQVLPFSTSVNNTVFLNNATEDAENFWNAKAIGSYGNNLLLAKSMGFPLKKIPENLLEKIAANSDNAFWIKTNNDLFDICKNVLGKVCIILDRTTNTLQWLQQFIADADSSGILREEIKVCFRDNKESKTGINEWIKIAGVGGKIEQGRILIFESKPAKWLFKDEQDVKILVTNNIYPPTNTLAKEWFGSHPCVLYLGDTKPTEQRGQKIVEL